MPVEQKQFDIEILGGRTTISEMLKDVDNEIKLKGYGKGWYLKKIELIGQIKYQIVVERIIP